jgi:hypothetical protein
MQVKGFECATFSAYQYAVQEYNLKLGKSLGCREFV